MAKINTLVFAGGAIHDWKGCSDEIVKVLSQRDEFEITRVEEDLDALVSPNLDPYDLVVFYYTLVKFRTHKRTGYSIMSLQVKATSVCTRQQIRSAGCPEYRSMVGAILSHIHATATIKSVSLIVNTKLRKGLTSLL